MDNPELKRSLFGYRKADVDAMLDARERMFERVTAEASQRRSEAEQLRADLDKARAESRAARDETESVRRELDAQLNDVRQELERVRSDLLRIDEERRGAATRAAALETQLNDARREITTLSERVQTADATEADLRTRLEGRTSVAPDTRELGDVIEATQQAIARIMAGARRSAEEDLTRVQRSREEIEEEIDRVRSWRDRIDPVRQDVVADIAVAQAQMSQTAERVGEALRPMSDALTALSNHLQQLARASGTGAFGEPSERLDLASHERERVDAQAEPDEAERVAQEPPPQPDTSAGAPFRADPWPDPWR